MLVQFNFENYKAFYDEASLDMTATSLKEHQYNLIQTDKEKYLKVAAIYGANASGKSSVLEAFGFMRHFVRNSFKFASSSTGIPYKNFAFEVEEKPSVFEVFFIKNQNEYQYGFEIDRKKVIEEWLYRRPLHQNNFTTIFEREQNEFKITDTIKEAKNFKSAVEDHTLFISLLASVKLPVVKEVFEWFTETVFLDFGNISLEHELTRTLPVEMNDPDFQQEAVVFLNAIGVPVHDLLFEKVKEEEEDMYNLFSLYKINGKLVKLPFHEESSGTVKMFTLFLHLTRVMHRGATILIDELDAKLHPLLLRYIITLFHDEKKNPKNAQLIYTTHDNYTLTKDLFRRDQIYFVEKHENLKAELYSLSEYKLDDDKKVRNDATYNKDYLLGKYGGVPVLKDIDLWIEGSESL